MWFLRTCGDHELLKCGHNVFFVVVVCFFFFGGGGGGGGLSRDMRIMLFFLAYYAMLQCPT